MKKKYIWVFIVIIFVVFSAREVWNMHLQYEGICVSLGRALTDEEKIRAVIREMNRPITSVVNMSTNVTESTDIGYLRSRKVPYKSVDEFLMENPDCCSVKIHETHYGSEESWGASKALGVYAGHVTVHYTLHYLDKDGIEKTIPDTLEWTIQNCGVVN